MEDFIMFMRKDAQKCDLWLLRVAVYLFVFFGVVQVDARKGDDVDWSPQGESRDWFDAANWNPAEVPDEDDDVTLSAEDLPGPIIRGGDVQLKKITLEGGALSIEGGTVTLSDKIEVKAGGFLSVTGAVITTKDLNVDGAKATFDGATLMLSGHVEAKKEANLSLTNVVVTAKELKLEESSLANFDGGELTLTEKVEVKKSAALSVINVVVTSKEFKVEEFGVVNVDGGELVVSEKAEIKKDSALNLLDGSFEFAELKVKEESVFRLDGGELIVEDVELEKKGEWIQTAGVVRSTGYIWIWEDSVFDATGGELILTDVEEDWPFRTDAKSTAGFHDLTIEAGVSLPKDSFESDAFSISGDWVNNGSVSLEGVTVTFDGEEAQRIEGTSPTAFDDVIVDNESNVYARSYSLEGEKTRVIGDIVTFVSESAEVELRATAGAEGVVVEFVAGNVAEEDVVELKLMSGDDEVVWSEARVVEEGDRSRVFFVVPGLEVGRKYDFNVRDEDGRTWRVADLPVESFKAKLKPSTEETGELVFDSIAGERYVIQWSPGLGEDWIDVREISAEEAETAAEVDYPQPEGEKGFFRVRRL